MEVTQGFLEELRRTCGANNCACVMVKDIILDPGLRQSCEMNYCGEYGRTWVCPPHCGAISDCIKKVSAYSQAIVVQTIRPLEDSYDFEGMEEAAKQFDAVFLKAVQTIRQHIKPQADGSCLPILCLSAGGCHRCEVCTVGEQKPCRHPDETFASLESHGIFVSDLAEKAGLNYINGQNTVTYFGAVFLPEDI